MKKFISFILAFTMAFSFAACGSSDVEIICPADFVDEGTTQESLDAAVSSAKYKSATLNEDGSVTYVLSKSAHKELMEMTRAEFKNAFDEIIADETNSIVAISVNDDYTEFKIELSTESVGFYETFAVLIFYMYGGLYNVWNGTPAENICVNYISQATGEVIETYNSIDIEE